MIGILGGSFDPVHNGHLHLARGALPALDLQRIYLVPAHRSPHKGETRAGNADRLEMLRLAMAGQPGLELDPCELERDPPSYTIDTLEHFNHRSTGPICLITGMDSFHHFDAWHRWREILERVHLVVVPRPGAGEPQRGTMAGELRRRRAVRAADLAGSRAGRILILDLPLLDISSTDIRARVAAGETLDELVPRAVANHIRQRGLYIAEN